MAESCITDAFTHVTPGNMEKQQSIVDRAPFKALKIKDSQILDTLEGRRICKYCCKSRKFYCHICCLPVIEKEYFPEVKLPVKIHVVVHKCEVTGKSTATHAAVLAREDVSIYVYPDVPSSDILNKKETVLVFPSKTAISVDDLFVKEIRHGDNVTIERISNEFPIKHAIFIDSTWHKTKAIYKDQRFQELRCVVLKSRISQFWRHQKKSPRWYLATIEAIYQFLVELHTCAFGTIDDYANLNDPIVQCTDENPVKENNSDVNLNQKYCGQYDNLLYFFKYMYEKIHSLYDHDKLWAYKRPLI